MIIQEEQHKFDTTSINSVSDVVKNVEWDDQDDITRNLFFHAKSFKGINKELDHVSSVLDTIEASQNTRNIEINAAGRMAEIEKAIHRLVIIGFVDDYTVEHERKSFSVSLSNASPEDIRDTILRYIGNYQRSKAKSVAKNLASSSLVNRKFLLDIVKSLLGFIYETIELGRRRALLEMTQLTSPDSSDEVIRERILAYLEKSEFDDQLDLIVENLETQYLVTAILEDIVSSPCAIIKRTGN